MKNLHSSSQYNRSVPVDFVFKILRQSEHDILQQYGRFAGSADDERDGYIHLSLAHQLPTTLTKHYGSESVHLLQIDAHSLGEGLRFEASRGGALFPHFYGALLLPMVASCHFVPFEERKTIPALFPQQTLRYHATGPFAPLHDLAQIAADAPAPSEAQNAILRGTGTMQLEGLNQDALTSRRGSLHEERNTNEPPAE